MFKFPPVFAVLLALAAAASAQTAPSPQAPAGPITTITVNARLVVLDVVVTDKNGKPVEDLTRDDFTVFEESLPQRLNSFEAPSAHALPPDTLTTDAATVFDPARPANFGQSPVTVLVLDQLNTAFADSAFARTSVRDFLKTQPAVLAQPTTLLTVYDRHFKQVAAYTRDRDALLRALAAEPNHYAWNLAQNGSADYGPIERLDQSLGALEQIAESSARIPGRKNVIWVGGGFPSLDPSTLISDNYNEIKSTIQHITNTLLDTHVTLYAIDPKSLASGMTEVTDPTQAEFAQIAGDGLAGNFNTFNGEEDFDHLAPVTGGRIVRGMNDVAHQIGISVALGSSFYTLGYRPSSASDKASSFRRIRVDVRRPGLTVRAREGYYDQRIIESNSTKSMSYDLSTAAVSTVPLNGLVVRAARSTSVSAPDPTFVVRVGAPNLTWKPTDDGGSNAGVAVLAVWLDGKGRMVGHILHGMSAHARPGVNLRDESKTADFVFSGPTPPKITAAKTLRFVVRDNASGRMGSFDMKVNVPAKSFVRSNDDGPRD